MAKSWKKIIVSGSHAELASASGSFSGSFEGDGSNLTGTGLGSVTEITTAAPLTGGPINTTGEVAIPSGSATADGYIASGSWTAFDSKVDGDSNATYIAHWSDSTTITGTAGFTFASSILTVPKVKASTSLAVGTATPSAITGRIDASNDIIAYSTSDIRFKLNRFPIASPLDKVNKLSGIKFLWDSELFDKHGYEGIDVGVIAQEVEEVLPEIVTTRENGYKAVKYEKLVPLLIEAIKELSYKVKILEGK